jgi:bacterioferritin (cytochrome b1)
MMGAKQVQHSRRGRRRGSARVAALLALAALAALAAGCGEGDRATDEEKAADVEVLNAALARELTVASAYGRGERLLRGPYRAVGREFRSQAQEHADALTKAIRGLGGRTDAEQEELDFAGVTSQADFLALAYGLENAALAAYLEATPRLATEAPRTLAASIGASHAQHLVILRQGLGATPAESASEPFEPGDLPPPGESTPPAE